MTLSQYAKTTACAALLLVSSVAHASFVRVGLCDGQTTPAENAVAKTGRGTVSAAIILPKERLAAYAGMRITGIRMAIAKTDGLSALEGWVAEGLSATPLATAAVASPAVGWNEVSFASPVTVPAAEDLAVGYSFSQEKSCKTILLGGLDEDDDFPYALDGCWIGKDGDWENRSQKADYDGSVCVELIVEDESLPARNLAFYQAALASNALRSDSMLRASVVMTNLGPEPLQPAYGYRLDGGATTWLASSAKTLAQQERDTFDLELPLGSLTADARHTLTLVGSDGSAQTVHELPFVVYTDASTRPYHLLLEEFSTEQCSNCERAIKTLEQMGREGLTATCTQITHHVGYLHDFLSVPDDEAYEYLYGNNGTWAPAIMFSRTYDAAWASEKSGVPAPVVSVGYADAFRPYLEHFLDCDALVGLTPQLTWDAETRRLTVDVDIEKSPLFDTQCPLPRISVILTEDSVHHHAQAGYSSESDFRHRHVYRQTLSQTWGDTIVWKGNTATAHYELTIPEEWTNHDKKDRDSLGNVRPDTCQVRQLAVVAFVNEYDAAYRTRCRVYNSATAELRDVLEGTSGISSPKADHAALRPDWYDLSGRRVAEPTQPGIYIRAGRKFVVK